MFNKQLINNFRHNKTPFYYYDTGLLQNTLFAAKKAASLYNYHLHFAVKANANPEILKIINKYSFGADCVSGNEIRRALSSGIPNYKIVFAGVGKTDEEIEYAIEQNIFYINCESIQELEIINQIAKKHTKKVRVALRINPNVDANTHDNITTGLSINKFGISANDISEIIHKIDYYENLIIDGLHFHIGSQIEDLIVFRKLCNVVNYYQDLFIKNGIKINHLNLGGGLGIDYNNPFNQIPDFTKYFSVFNKYLKIKENQTIHFEPGRSIVGQSGILISKVLYVKDNGNIKTLILDAGFTELLRPALYQAKHKIINLSSNQSSEVYDVAGPICETSDYFAKSVMLPKSQRGDLIAIMSSGAYGEVMASQYNLRPVIRTLNSNFFNPISQDYQL